MAIYTPRGLKVRIAVPYAFGLMARLHPKVSAFRVLKTTEAIENVPGMLAFIAGLAAFAMRLAPFQIGLVVAGAEMAGVLINTYGFYIIPGLVGLCTLYSYFVGYGIYFIAALLIGFTLGGWQAAVAFLVAKIVAGVVGLMVEFWRTRRYHKLTGHAFTGSEVSFFNAYRLHASRNGVTTDIDLSDEELEEDSWAATFELFAMERPEAVRRFTID